MKTPIISGREPTATEEEKRLGVERAGELSAKVNQVIINYFNICAITEGNILQNNVTVVC